jgi:hypothetical protein
MQPDTAKVGDQSMSEGQGATPEMDEQARLTKAIQVYGEIGLGPTRTIAQLVRAQFPLEQIRKHFPDVPLSDYPEAPPAGASKRRPLTGGRGGRTEPNAAMLLAPTLTRLTASPTPNPGLSNAASLLRADGRQGAPNHSRSAPTAPAIAALTTDDAISFQYVPLIQCSFPHADQGETATFSRRNGWLELTLSTARPEMGLPYGVPARLLTIYCASEAIRTRSPEIYLGKSVQDFLRRLDVPITRGERGSQRVYANQLLRLIHCAVSIDENIRDANGRTGLHIRQALFAQEAQLWWDTEGVGQGSSLVLSSVLFDSILERSAPLSTNAIKQLRKSPMDLDVYAWLVHRLFNLGKPSTVTWEQLSGQFGHGYAEPRKFRHYFLDSLKRVQVAYPEAKLKVGNVGLILLPSKPHVARAALNARR